jgi:hypothetical protein
MRKRRRMMSVVEFPQLDARLNFVTYMTKAEEGARVNQAFELVVAEPGIDGHEITTRLGLTQDEYRKHVLPSLSNIQRAHYEAGWFPGPHVREPFSRVDRGLDPEAFASIQHVAVFVTNTNASNLVGDAPAQRALAREHLNVTLKHWSEDLEKEMAIARSREYRKLFCDAATSTDWSKSHADVPGLVQDDGRKKIEDTTKSGVVLPQYFIEVITAGLTDQSAPRALPDHFLVAERDEHVLSMHRRPKIVLHRSLAWGPPSYNSASQSIPGASYAQRVTDELAHSVSDGYVYLFDVATDSGPSS